jgi:hypothetical protein
MASLIPKVNATAGSATAPGTGALVTGELAENKYTGRLYVKTEAGTVLDPARVTLTGDVTGSTATATTETQGGTIATTLATVGASKGGTGLTSTPANGQVPIGNGTGYTLATLTAGTNVTITNGAGTITINSASTLLNGAKAWINFNGSTSTIRANYNISSITKNATGDYTINFTTAMTDANYAVAITAQGSSASNLYAPVLYAGTLTGGGQLVAPTTSSFRFMVTTLAFSGGVDSAIINCQVFGN